MSLMEETIKFEFEKETKNCVRYRELEDQEHNPVIRTIYIRKEYIGNTIPEEIEIKLKIV